MYLYSSIAQRQSIRLLTEGSLVRTQLGELTRKHLLTSFFVYKNIYEIKKSKKEPIPDPPADGYGFSLAE